MLCGIQDAELLQAHWDLQRPEWRKTVAAACAELEGVIKPDMRKCQRSLKVRPDLGTRTQTRQDKTRDFVCSSQPG